MEVPSTEQPRQRSQLPSKGQGRRDRKKQGVSFTGTWLGSLNIPYSTECGKHYSTSLEALLWDLGDVFVLQITRGRRAYPTPTPTPTLVPIPGKAANQARGAARFVFGKERNSDHLRNCKIVHTLT